MIAWRAAVGVMVALLATAVAVPSGGTQTPTAPGPILYSRGGDEDDQCGEIWSIEPRGGAPRPLDVGPGVSCDPEWSPDARHIAFTANRGGTQLRIYVADANGANAVAVTHSPLGGDDFMPAWSPDGTRIAFERRPAGGGSYNLFVVDADGTHERQLTHGHGFDGTPTWSPDGRILFVSDRPAHQPRRCKSCSSLYVIRVSDGHTSRITRRSVNALMPSWSPDGTHIAWARARSLDGVLGLYVMRSDRSDVRRLDTAGESPAWSPDSRTIVYASGGGLVLIGVDGSGRRQLTTLDGGTSPSWRPVSAGS